ncbi:MAG TPA: RcpC/CpaB family pilus assembly protein [Propionicimonas sp.]
MRARRTVYIVIFVAASLIAAGAYYLAQPRVEVVRAREDIAVLTPISADMVELVRVSPLGAPSSSARSLDAVVGQYAALPILAGQDVDTRAIEVTPGSQAFGFGAPLGPGEVAFALPVAADQAVGGALSPGARVDVIAVPNELKTGLAAASPGPGAVTMGQGLTILALRTGDGHQLTDVAAGGSTAVVPPKLGSVVVAIPAARVADFATAALTSTFYLALDPNQPGAAAVP